MNHPVRLTGFNQMATYEGAGNAPDACGWTWHVPSPNLGANVAKWGFNSVRLPVSWADLEPQAPSLVNGQIVHHWNTQYLQALDAIVADLGAHHVYAIMVMTQQAVSPAYKLYDGRNCEGSGMPPWLFPNAATETYDAGWCDFFADKQPPGIPERPVEGFIAAWQTLARRYASNPTVAATDILNEPGGAFECVWRHLTKVLPPYLDSFNARVGAAIRAVSPNVLLIMEDENESEGPDGHFMTSTVGLRNVVYEWHSYAKNWAAGKPPLDAELKFARRIRAPFMLGEFDAFNADDNANPPLDANWQSDLTTMMSYLKQNAISWTVENYDGEFSILQPNSNVPKQPLLGMLQAGLGSPANGPSPIDATGDQGIGATPGSAWPILQSFLDGHGGVFSRSAGAGQRRLSAARGRRRARRRRRRAHVRHRHARRPRVRH